MTIQPTIIQKKASGWTATTNIVLGELPANSMGGAGERILRISTSKWDGGRGICSHASVVESRQSLSGEYRIETFGICEDFSKRLIATPNVRVTEKSVMAHHIKALKEFPLIEEEARAFYAAKQQNNAA